MLLINSQYKYYNYYFTLFCKQHSRSRWQRVYSNQKNIINKLKGTKDMYNMELMDIMKEISTKICKLFSVKHVKTPLIEDANLFARTLGESSDVVSKQMFYIHNNEKINTSNNNHGMVLRPEGTAGIVRSLINRGINSKMPMEKFYYYGSMFRYERPQRGRLREFTQLGVEFIGNGADDPYIDVELIHLANEILIALGVHKSCHLLINSLGDSDTRIAYSNILKSYLRQYYTDLSHDSQQRYDRGNYLRILDSKSLQDKAILRKSDFPKISDYFSFQSDLRYQQVIKGLENLNIKYEHDPYLVRGLDYYSHTCFEFVNDQQMGQSAVLAGGKYDELFHILGNPNGAIPSIGFAAGIERLMLLRENINNKSSVQYNEGNDHITFFQNLRKPFQVVFMIIDHKNFNHIDKNCINETDDNVDIQNNSQIDNDNYEFYNNNNSIGKNGKDYCSNYCDKENHSENGMSHNDTLHLYASRVIYKIRQHFLQTGKFNENIEFNVLKGRSVKKMMKKAASNSTDLVVLIGENEEKCQCLQLKCMKEEKQNQFNNIIDAIKHIEMKLNK